MATSTLLPVFRESVSLSSSRGMAVYNLPPQYPAPPGLGIVVGVVEMATNILLTYPKISTPYSKKQLLSRSKQSLFYVPSSAVSTNHSLRTTHAKAIFALIKEHTGFGDYMNQTDFSPFGLVANEKKGSPVKKFQCKSKNNNDQESSWPNICAIIVGSSFCIAIAIFCLGFPKKLRLCHTTVVPYSCLIDDIRAKRVTHVQFVKDSSVIYYNTNTSVDQIAKPSKTVLGQTALVKAFASSKWQYQTVNVGDDKSPLIKWLDYLKIAYGSDPKPLSLTSKDILSFIFKTFPYFIFLSLECYLISTQLNLGKKKKRKEQPVTFADVEGVGDAKAELLKIISCLNKDRKDRKLRSKLPKGVLLTGPPGTGKTLLARALATEAGVSFHAVSATEFVEMYVGMGAARVRELFEKARKSAPSIIFIDEIDAVGGQRGRDLNSECDQTLNQLLIEMDGFYKDDNVMVLAATNIPEKLDPALLRAGRFTTKVVVGLPDQEGRRKIFDLYMRNVPMQEDKENICDYVASSTQGLVGSDLKEIADESERLAAHRDGEFVTFDDVRQAVDRAQQNCHVVKRKEQSVTFADVEGVGDAKAELLKIVSCLNKDRKDTKLWPKLPKGVLLTGPPGTGKTLLARALATEAGVSFHAVSATEFVEKYVGTGAARVRELFEKARKSAPSIIFIDEIDAVGGQRGRDLNSECDQTLNQLLIEMDGFYKDDNVMVLAATNIPEKLDPALLRAGRFTTKVVVGLPDQEGRRKIFDLYMRNVPMQEDKESICDYVASRTEGLVGSDLKEIADESERLAAHRDGEFVTFDDVRQAVDKAQQNYHVVKMMKIRPGS